MSIDDDIYDIQNVCEGTPEETAFNRLSSYVAGLEKANEEMFRDLSILRKAFMIVKGSSVEEQFDISMLNLNLGTACDRLEDLLNELNGQTLHEAKEFLKRFRNIPKKKEPVPVTEMRINEMELSTRIINCLNGVGVDTIGDLYNSTGRQLRDIYGFGARSYWELYDTLDNYGFTLNLYNNEHPALKLKEPSDA